MLSWFKKIASKKTEPASVSVDQVAALIKGSYPRLYKPGMYSPPKHRCSKWLVIRGPCVGSNSHSGTLIVDARKISIWAADHADKTWTSSEAEQAAKEFLPIWLKDADQSDETYTIPDKQMLAVLQPYDQDFIYMLAIKHWCPECAEWQDNVICGSKDRARQGKESQWTSEWHCLQGHLVHREKNSIRYF